MAPGCLVVLLSLAAILCTQSLPRLGVLAEDPREAGDGSSGAQFLRSVIRRMGGKTDEDNSVQDLAKPVADLKAALERVSESMAVDPTAQLPSGPETTGQASDVSGDPGPPYVLAPPQDLELTGPGPSLAPFGSAPPPIQAPPLSKDELSAVYQAVVDKGLVLDFSSVKGGYLPGGGPGPADQGQPSPLSDQAGQASAAGGNAGFYYYFFPIKGLTDQRSPQLQQHGQPQQQGGFPEGDGSPSVEQAAALSMMGALGADMNNLMSSGDSQKSVEPLFMAMAGFIGMALMFVLSVLFLPKWGTLRSRGVTALKHAPDELASLTKLVVQSIEGKDCSERIACEVGRAVRTMRLGNKPLRVLEIILPPNLSKQIGHIRKAARKAEKCNFIPCKYRASFKPFLPHKAVPNKLPPPRLPVNRAAPPSPSSPPSPVTTPPQPAPPNTTPRSKPLPHSKPPPPIKPPRIKIFMGNNNKNYSGSPHLDHLKNRNGNNSKQWQNRQRFHPSRSTTSHPL